MGGNGEGGRLLEVVESKGKGGAGGGRGRKAEIHLLTIVVITSIMGRRKSQEVDDDQYPQE
jgi:hypothetical protein